MGIQTREDNQLLPQLRHHATTTVAIGLLLLSWYVWYFLLMALTEGWGAPWDTTNIRPPVGHWQRTLNDFFESGIGSYLPAVIFLASSILLYLRTLTRMGNVQGATIIYGVGNLAALIVLFVVIFVFQTTIERIPAHLTPDDWAYWGDFRREWPLPFSALVLIATLFWLQSTQARDFPTISSGSPSHTDNR